MDKDTKLYKDILEAWGLDEQYWMVVEECGELIAEINKYRRGRSTLDNVMNEAADVYLMLNQIRVLDEELFDKYFEKKRNRIEGLLNKHKETEGDK